MKTKVSIKDRVRFGADWIQGTLSMLLLRPLGLLNWLCRGMPMLNSRAGTSMSIDGRYLISWSWKGLIYLIEMGCAGCPPVVTSFVVQPKPWGAHFSKDMQQIIITHGLAKRTILSSSPADGFCRRKFPIIQEWISGECHPRNIVQFISQTSSAYWKFEADPDARTKWGPPDLFPLPPTADIDYDWEEWAAHGSNRYLDIPRDTCGNDG